MDHEVFTYLEEHYDEILADLFELLSIPSISTESDSGESMTQAVSFLMDYLTESGFNNVEEIETARHPAVYAEYLEAGAGVPTVLVYGHYDVQPVDPLESWESDPFKPEVRNGKIYARGASDDKGQLFMHLAVFKAYFNVHGKLPLNVKICIEGEEEIGSANLYELLKEDQPRFSNDFVMISDSGMISPEQPTVLYGLKGFIGFEIEVEGPDYDLHSGLYGGAVKNPAFALTEIIQSLKNEDEVIQVPGFYDDVEELTTLERNLIKKVPTENYEQTIGISKTVSESGYSAAEHTMARPTLEINGIYSGYQGEGTKTIIPSVAHAKITCRLVPKQDPKHILQSITDYIEKIKPAGVTVKVKAEPMSAGAYKVDPENPLIRQAAESYSYIFGKETVYVRMGGSIPVVEWFDEIYDVPVILLGFGTPEDQIHAPNESFPLANFTRGMQVIAHYWSSFIKEEA